MELGAAAAGRSGTSRRRTRHRRPAGGPQRLRRIALLAALLALLPGAVSYLSTMREPSNSSFGIRTVEWLREHGAAGLVAQVESTYYTLTAPSKGGPTLRALPRVGAGAPALGSPSKGAAPVAAYRPPPVAPLIHPALPGEGVWRATRPGFEADPPVLLTTLRNQPEYPRVVAGLAWIDTKRTTLTLRPGSPRALGIGPARLDGAAVCKPGQAARELQQRLQTERLPRRGRAERPHLCGHARRPGDNRGLLER